MVRLGIRTLLEGRRDWKVCGEAATGGETVEKTRALRPDLRLLDIAMPDMDAPEAIQEIMEVCPAVKVIALARHGLGELAARGPGCRSAGALIENPQHLIGESSAKLPRVHSK